MKNKYIVFLIVLIILLTLYMICFKIFKVQDIILRNIYTTKYSEYVEKYADENDVDKYMIYAIIKAESNFNNNVRSSSNAQGLMQLMKDTAKEIAKKSENTKESKDINLFDPETNIKLGSAYLLKYYNGKSVLALTAYNAGIGNVDTWIKTGVIKQDGSDPENIPYKETNNYVRKILKNYEMYIKLYSN